MEQLKRAAEWKECQELDDHLDPKHKQRLRGGVRVRRKEVTAALQFKKNRRCNQIKCCTLMKYHGCSDGSHTRLGGARSPSDVTQAIKSPPTHTFLICGICVKTQQGQRSCCSQRNLLLLSIGVTHVHRERHRNVAGNS